MVAGLNCVINVWRINYSDDDDVGGAVVTGTCYYFKVPARIQANPESQLLLQQGLETIRTFSVVLAPGTLDIRERDEIEVYKPRDHPYYGDRFRVISMRYSDFNPRDARNYLMLQVVKNVKAHAQQ